MGTHGDTPWMESTIGLRRSTATRCGLLVVLAFTTGLAGCSKTTAPPTAASPAPPSAPSPTTSAALPSATSSATPLASPSPTVTISATYGESANGSTVHVKVGDQFIIALGWNTKLVGLDNWEMQYQDGLTLVSWDEDYTKAPHPPTMQGANATAIWTMKATKRGRYTLEATALGKEHFAPPRYEDYTMTVIVS